MLQPCCSHHGGQGRLYGAGQGGRLSGLCLFNVTVIVKLEAAFGGNMPHATGGAIVVNLA